LKLDALAHLANALMDDIVAAPPGMLQIRTVWKGRFAHLSMRVVHRAGNSALLLGEIH